MDDLQARVNSLQHEVKDLGRSVQIVENNVEHMSSKLDAVEAEQKELVRQIHRDREQIFERLGELKDIMRDERAKDYDKLANRVEEIEKWRWKSIGIAAVLIFISTLIPWASILAL